MAKILSKRKKEWLKVQNTRFNFNYSVCLDSDYLKSAFLMLRFLCFFFFFFVQPTIVDRSSVNSTLVHCSRVPQTQLFINFFIKNGSHSTIHTFKNYFATMFLVFSFQFQQNKFNPNRPIVIRIRTKFSSKLVWSYFFELTR